MPPPATCPYAKVSGGTLQHPGQSKTHFFKDIETELLVLSNLLTANLPATLLPDPCDPVGEMEVAEVFIEVKHPDTPNQVEKLIDKFNGELAKRCAYGVSVLALKDAFETASQSIHSPQVDRDKAFDALVSKIDASARTALSRAARLTPRFEAPPRSCPERNSSTISAPFADSQTPWCSRSVRILRKFERLSMRSAEYLLNHRGSTMRWNPHWLRGRTWGSPSLCELDRHPTEDGHRIGQHPRNRCCPLRAYAAVTRHRKPVTRP